MRSGLKFWFLAQELGAGTLAQDFEDSTLGYKPTPVSQVKTQTPLQY